MAVLPNFGTISGAYSATYAGLSVGQVAMGGYRMRYSYDVKPINYDAVGSSPVDSLFMGLSMFLDFVCMEFKADANTIRRMSWPFDINNWGGGLRGAVGPAGYSIFKQAQPFIMRACTPALVDPVTITFPKTYLAPGFEVSQDHSGTTERVIPMRLIVFPVDGTYTTDEVGTYTKIGTLLGLEGIGNTSAMLTAAATFRPPQGCSNNIYFAETVNT
jgi:hypothetical protein